MKHETRRWRRFEDSLPAEWPFRDPERFPASNGHLLPTPQWWQAGPAAWGCFRSHYRVLEEALSNEHNSILVFEDDAQFVPDFSQRVCRFLDSLPNDWEWIYLGGQHLDQEWGLPTKINELVYRPFNVHRAHAYAIRGRRAMDTAVSNFAI